MTVAPIVEDPQENTIYFKQLYQLSVDILDKKIDNISMGILSMGMTGDYLAAVKNRELLL